ncbi:MAG: OmpA family protein [Marinibacterium sp.]
MKSGLLLATTFILAAAVSFVASGYAVSRVEDGTEIGVRRALDRADMDWAEVEADGLRVVLSGTAPTEATRFQALATAGRVVDAARVIDDMMVAETAAPEPPRYAAEILRNRSGISLVGLIPASTDRDALTARLESIRPSTGDNIVADFLESSPYPAPDTWEPALDFALTALERLPQSKISVAPGRVEVSAMTGDPESRDRIDLDLHRAAPKGVAVVLNLSAPRPAIAPFTLRYVLAPEGGRFDACSAPDQAAADQIVAAARSAADLLGSDTCTLGLGAPSPKWASAASQSITALARLGGGTLTMTDTDIALVAANAITPKLFDQVVGDLDAALPPAFSLHAVLPEPDSDEPAGPSEFYATRSPEGLVQLRGRVSSVDDRALANSFARARFGGENVHTAARIADDLPPDWIVRVLTALEALAELSNGVVTVTEDSIRVAGVSTNPDIHADLSSLITSKLGDTARFDLAVAYRPPPPPKDLPFTAEECETKVAEILAEDRILFEPGSATVTEGSNGILDAIAGVLDRCEGIPIEIQGHTDSQGRESMNLALSQQRADAVLTELARRDVRITSLRTKGYGESRPIAENDSEEGREANRRIEFHLIQRSSAVDDETTLDKLSAPPGSALPDSDPAQPALEDAATDPGTAADTSSPANSDNPANEVPSE